MKTSLRGQQFIKDKEGERLVAYQDAVGIWTIGIGHTSDDYFAVKRGQKITKAKMLDLFRHDMEEVERAINTMVSRPLNGNQYGAVASFILNIGVEGFRGSTLRRRINQGASAAAITHAFGMWVKAGNPKHTLPGLVRRRSEEASLYHTPAELGHAPVILPDTGKPTPQLATTRAAKNGIIESGDGAFAVNSGTSLTGTGAVAGVIREQTDQLSFIADYSQIIQYIVVAMVVLGVGLTLYGLYSKFKDK